MAKFDIAENKITKRNFIIVLIVVALLTAFFCLASIFSSFGYKQSLFALKEEESIE